MSNTEILHEKIEIFGQTDFIYLKHAKNGMPVAELCRQYNMSSSTFYIWRAKYGGMDASLIARLRELEHENASLKRMYADAHIRAEVVAEAFAKKIVRPSNVLDGQNSRRKWKIEHLPGMYAFKISVCCYRYTRKLFDENAYIADLLLGLSKSQRNWGFGLCFLYLCNVNGYVWNHKRVYRIYPELELNLCIKPKNA